MEDKQVMLATELKHEIIDGHPWFKDIFPEGTILRNSKKVSGILKQKLVRAGAFYAICQVQIIEACVTHACDSPHTLISVSGQQETENIQI